jgi:hypothetical protein
MKVPIQPLISANVWRLGGDTAELEITVNEDFMTSDGLWWPKSKRGPGATFAKIVPLTIDSNEVLFPDFELDSTIDALVNRNARYDAYIKAEDGRRVPFVLGFALRQLTDGDPSTTWSEIILLRDADYDRKRTLTGSLMDNVYSLITAAIGGLSKANVVNYGVTALTANPLNPTDPIAVGANDPTWVSFRAGRGLVQKSGSVDLIDGGVSSSVLTDVVTPDSVIICTPRSPDILGTPRVLPDDIVEGESFVIRSTNEGDLGRVDWAITAPNP